MKNKYRVFIYIPTFCFIMFVLGTGGFILTLPMTDPIESRAWIVLSFILISLLPFLLFAWSYFKMWPCVEFKKEGIEKTLLGYKQRFITWDEIYEIRRIRTGISEWIFFSKTDLKEKTISYCRRRRDNIYIVSNKEVEESISEFAPSRILQT